MLRIYHNNRCSKSRQALELIQKSGKEVEVVEYMKTPPTADELRDVLQKLHLKPEQLLRKGETTFKEHYKGKSLTADEWIEVMVAHPELIERPIVVTENRAVLGRPPENVQELL